MDTKVTKGLTETQRNNMVKFIIRTILKMDDAKLRNIYCFVLHIK